jgi:hypothetical protein
MVKTTLKANDKIRVNNVEFGLPRNYSVFTLVSYAANSRNPDADLQRWRERGENEVCLLPEGTMLLGKGYDRPKDPETVLNIGDTVEIDGVEYEITPGPRHAKANIGLKAPDGSVSRY